MNMVNGEAETLDPDRHLERSARLHRRARALHDGGRIELYHRSSVVIRLARDDTGNRSLARAGREDGIAIRTDSQGTGAIGFAAAAGCDSRSVRWAVLRAGEGGSAGSLPSVRPEADRQPLVDREPGTRLPSPRELETWLERAWGELAGQCDGEELKPAEAWVEAASTVESIVLDEGFAASRKRSRAWAMVRLRPRARRERSPRPIFTASRRWSDLSAGEWSRALAERGPMTGAIAASRTGKVDVTFIPEASAVLVHALARVLHVGPGPATAPPVGPGWRLTDEPRSPGALFGGSFDDTGTPTRRRVLADGSRVIEALDGPGTLRRPSFRDPPRPLPTHLVVEGGAATAMRQGVTVTEMTLHPLPQGRLVIVFDGALRREDEIGPLVRGGSISTTPEALVSRCVAATGPARTFHRGVRTPALLFEGLEVRI